MVTIPAKAKNRLIAGVKKFQPIIKKAQDMDINESDTVTIISDMLFEVFGYDKYSEITSEFAIKKTFCDIAIKINGTPKLLIEAKAAGLNLKEQHIRQAVDYGANYGIEWVVLTNSVTWKIYKIGFGKPVTADLVYEFDMSSINAKKQNDLEALFYLCKESISKGNKSLLDEYHDQQQLVNKFIISQIMLADPVLDAVRKTIKKMSSDVKVSNDEIHKIISEEVFKREILEDERAGDALKKVTKALKPSVKSAAKEASE